MKLKEILDFDHEVDYIRQLIDRINLYNEVVIFGAGIGGKITLDILNTYKCINKMKIFSDNNPNKIKTDYNGYLVVEPQKILDYVKKPLVLVSSTAFDKIVEQLKAYGIQANDIYYFQPAGLSDKKNEDKKYISSNLERFEWIYDKLKDSKSKRIFVSLLNYKMSKDIKYLDTMKEDIDTEENQYFDKNLLLTNRQFQGGFVDAGAYTGDTMEAFYRNFPEYTGIYYCFEAGQEIYKRLLSNVELFCKEIGSFNVQCFNIATWDEKGTLCFDTTNSGGGQGSRISDSGEYVDCDTLDHVLHDKQIGFIKMDIEGAEHKSLEGARTIIGKQHPVLAICVYHKKEDMFDIPELIESIAPEKYDFYIRQYRYGQSETVLYAIPK